MKFWDHQHNARSETRRLLLGFAPAPMLASTQSDEERAAPRVKF